MRFSVEAEFFEAHRREYCSPSVASKSMTQRAIWSLFWGLPKFFLRKSSDVIFCHLDQTRSNVVYMIALLIVADMLGVWRLVILQFRDIVLFSFSETRYFAEWCIVHPVPAGYEPGQRILEK